MRAFMASMPKIAFHAKLCRQRKGFSFDAHSSLSNLTSMAFHFSFFIIGHRMAFRLPFFFLLFLSSTKKGDRIGRERGGRIPSTSSAETLRCVALHGLLLVGIYLVSIMTGTYGPD